ncbi:MAG: leucine-rich repeat domain-containing protein [Candidatus Hodarchaeota archaeon]
MALTPKKIYEDLKKKDIDKQSAADLLIFLIENADYVETRLESINILQKIDFKNKKIFSVLENLLISDSYEEIRTLAANTLKVLFREKALSPLKWALEHEKSWQFLMKLVSIISEIDNKAAKSILIDKIKKFDNYKFNISLSPFFKTKEVRWFNIEKIVEIINNYVIINYFEELSKEINYQIEKGLVTELNLSFISKNVFGWKILTNLTIFINIFKYLKKLELRDNRIAIFPDSIVNLNSLKYLDLSHNIIDKLPESVSNLKSLEYLNLRYNNLSEIPNSIGSLNLLKTLDLKHNKLTTLPKSISKLKSLEILNLHGNQFNTIPTSLKGLSSLKILKLGLNSLKYIPDWIKNLGFLKKLGLGGNKSLSNFQEWIDFLPPIKELNLYDNDIKELPESIGSLNSLEVLILPNNQLTTLPESFKNLSLKKLDLSYNNFITLPEWIGSFSSLEELNLDGNKLKALPESIGSLSSLKILSISLNKDIIKLPKSIKDLQKKGLQINK